MNPTIHTIPVKFDIWDTQYTITDYGDRMSIKCPCRKHERRNSQSWSLGHYTETITNPNTIGIIRKMIDSGSVGLTPKNHVMDFTVAEVIFGLPTAYGWTPEDFE